MDMVSKFMKQEKTKQILSAVLSAICFIAVMYLTEQVLKPDYLIKALIKLSTIFLILLTNAKIFHKNLKDCIFFRKMKPAKYLFLFMLIVFSGVLVIFFLIRNYLDLSSIRQNLMTKEQLTKQNCLFVFAYIAIVNSFLEEALFRGLLYHLFEENSKAGMLFSAGTFSLYHLGIIDNWLNPVILIFCIAGLAAAGIFLQILCNHYDSLKASWIVHGCANLAINTIGFILIYSN